MNVSENRPSPTSDLSNTVKGGMKRLTLNRRQMVVGLASATAAGFAVGRLFNMAARPKESDFFESAFQYADSSQTGLFEDESFFLHDLSSHPESASRLIRIHEELPNFDGMKFRKVDVSGRTFENEADWIETLSLVHEKSYLKRVSDKIDQRDYLTKSRWSPYGGPHARMAAYKAAVGSAELAQLIGTGKMRNGFALIRPPSHHAGRDFSGGYCFVNSVAFAAKHAAQAIAQPVLILDLDVHHGDGTENIFYADPGVSYVSLHQDDWPNTGVLEKIGDAAGRGGNFNLPMPPGLTGASWLEAMEKFVVPAIEKVRPAMIFVSMGYDTHWRDPQGSMALTVSDQMALVHAVQKIADQVCAGRVMYSLEGGYEREATAFGVLNTLRRLVSDGSAAVIDPLGSPAERGAEEAAGLEKAFRLKLDAARKLHGL